jgi:hypothetical protein
MCPDDQVPTATFSSLHFILVCGRKNWEEARADCQARGGDLASIHSAAENELVYNLYVTKTQWPVWIGLNKLVPVGSTSWRWSDDTEVGYTNWDPIGTLDGGLAAFYDGAFSSSRWTADMDPLGGDSGRPYLCKTATAVSASDDPPSDERSPPATSSASLDDEASVDDEASADDGAWMSDQTEFVLLLIACAICVAPSLRFLIKRVQEKHAAAETSGGAGSASDAVPTGPPGISVYVDPAGIPHATNESAIHINENDAAAETSGGAGSASDAVKTNEVAIHIDENDAAAKTSGGAGSAGDAVKTNKVAIHLDENEHPGLKTMLPLWLWDFYDVYTFTLVGADLKEKARPEKLMTVWILFHSIYAFGILIPLAHFGAKGSLRIYVVIEAAYDLLQGAVVAFLWEIEEELGESRWMRDGESLKWTYFTICCITSTVDGVIIKLPTAGLHL